MGDFEEGGEGPSDRLKTPEAKSLYRSIIF
jgi:hypothetical protein